MDELTWTPDVARLDWFELWEHNPKTMTKPRADRLRKSWEEMGQYQTLAVGPNGECYDGHQRVKTLQAAGYAGDYQVRVLRASRPLTDDERARVILDSSVGTVGVLNFDVLAGWDRSLLLNAGFDSTLLAEWNDQSANLALMLEAENGTVDDTYTRKIKPPEYTPRGLGAPDIRTLYDDSKTKELIERIDVSDLISDEEKTFLRAAARRHTVLDFENIADYYAFASPGLQTLMEDNALVIIDLNEAIKQGFVELSVKIAEMVRDEYGDE